MSGNGELFVKMENQFYVRIQLSHVLFVKMENYFYVRIQLTNQFPNLRGNQFPSLKEEVKGLMSWLGLFLTLLQVNSQSKGGS